MNLAHKFRTLVANFFTGVLNQDEPPTIQLTAEIVRRMDRLGLCLGPGRSGTEAVKHALAWYEISMEHAAENGTIIFRDTGGNEERFTGEQLGMKRTLRPL